MKKKIEFNYKKIMLAVLLVALCSVGMAGTYALFHNSTNEVINNFKVGYVNVAVDERYKEGEDATEHEDASNHEKNYNELINKGDSESKIVKIKNKGIDAYIRVTLEANVVSDTNSNEVLLGAANVKYTFASNTSWKVDQEGTYYYSKVLGMNEDSDVLIEKVTTLDAVPEGYHIEVKVLTDAISAKPKTNLQKAWSVENFENMNDVN